MAQQIASLEARISANTSGLDAGLRRTQQVLNQTADQFQRVGMAMTLGITLPVVGAGAALAKFASDAVESENLFDVSMGAMADSTRAWSMEVSKALGLNSYEVRKSVGMFNAMFTGMKIGEQASADMAKGLTELSYDLASFYNLSESDALLKLQAGIMGEVEPLRRLGVLVDENTVKTYAMEQGWISAGQEMSQQQKVLARYGVILDQTSKAQGDLARTADSPANAMRRIQNEAHEAAIELGQVFLPMASEALNWVADTGVPAAVQAVERFKESWGELSDEARRNIIITAGLLVAGGPLLTGIGMGIRGVGMLGQAFLKIPGMARWAVAAAALEVAGLLALMGRAQSMSYEEYRGAALASGADAFSIATEEQFRAQQDRVGQWQQWITETVAGTAQEVAASVADFGFDALAAQAEGLGASFNAWLGPLNRATVGMGDLRRAELEAVQEATSLGREFAEHPSIADATAQATAREAAAIDTLKDALDAAGISQSEYIDYLVAQHPATIAAGQAVEALGLRIQGLRDQQEALNASMAASQQIIAGYQRQIHDLNLAQEALGDQVRAGQDALSAMQDKAAGLGAALSDAKAKLADLSRPQLEGMGEAEDQAAWIQRQKQRVEYAKKNKLSMEEVLKLFPYLTDAEAEFSETLPTSIRLLDKMAEALSLQSALEFDEALRQIAKTAGETEEELTFDEAITQIGATKDEINRLGSELSGVNAAIAAQQEYLKGLSEQQAALDKQVRALNEAIYQEQQHIAALQEASALYEKQIETLQTDLQLAEDYQDDLTDALADAYEWILDDKRAIGELGAETVLQAGVVDEAATSILTAFTGLVDQEVASAKAAIDGLVAHFNEAKAAMAGGLPSASGGTESHAIGGIVGGAIGEPRLIIAHGGERVQTVAERASGGEGVTFNYQPTIYAQQAPDPVREYHVARALLG